MITKKIMEIIIMDTMMMMMMMMGRMNNVVKAWNLTHIVINLALNLQRNGK